MFMVVSTSAAPFRVGSKMRMAYWLATGVATARELGLVEFEPTIDMKNVGNFWVTYTSQARALPVFGPFFGGMLTVMVTFPLVPAVPLPPVMTGTPMFVQA